MQDWTVKVADFGSGTLMDQLRGAARPAPPVAGGLSRLFARGSGSVGPAVRESVVDTQGDEVQLCCV